MSLAPEGKTTGASKSMREITLNVFSKIISTLKWLNRYDVVHY